MDVANRYLQLSRLGRETFLDAVAHGALIRCRRNRLRHARGTEGNGDGTAVAPSTPAIAPVRPARYNLEIYPLAKKPGTAFVDVITVGRTDNNDIQIDDVSVSRFHAFLRQRHGRWVICDAGSRNGTRVSGDVLPPRRELALANGTPIHLGAVALAFYLADGLYDVLSSPMWL